MFVYYAKLSILSSTKPIKTKTKVINVAMIFLVKKQLQFSTPNTKENKTMASPRVVEFLLFWLPAIHHITFEHHVVISNDVRCFLDGIFKGEH